MTEKIDKQLATAWQRRTELEQEQHRSFKIDKRAADPEARTVEIAFSSTEPYERFFGIEVLDHDPQSVRLDRLNGGAAVLVNHDTDDQVGVVDSARIDADGIGRAVIRFSRSQRGEEIYQDVNDDIRKLVSVGYRIHKYETTEREGLPDMVRVTDWEPFEVSIVAIPADTTVGVGRSSETQTKTVEKPTEEPTMDKQKDTEMEVETTAPKTEQRQAPAFDAEKERNKLRTEENKRRSDIDALADKYDLSDLGRQAVSEGWSVPQFNEKALEAIGKANSQVRQVSQHDGEVDLSSNDKKRFSLLRLMEAISNPNDRTALRKAEFELEVSAEAQRGFGNDFKCRGEFIPNSLLSGQQRTLSAGTATDGAELVATDLLAGSYIDVLRNASAVLDAGARFIPGLVGNVDIPRQTSGAAATWISAEDGDATVGEAQFDQVSMSPKDLACYTEVTRRLLQQSTPAIEGIVRNDLIVAQALGLDAAALYGSGAAGQPLGVSGQTGVNNFNFAAADPVYAEIIRMIKEVMADNALTGTPSWIIEANGWEALSLTSKQASGVEGNFILNDTDTIKGYGYRVSNQVTAEDYFFGDWSQVLIGEWGGIELNVDPYTHSLKGKIRYVMFKTADVAVRHGEHFAFCNDGV